MSENNIELLIQLGVDKAPSEQNLQNQINELSKKLKADIKLDFGEKDQQSLKVTASDLVKISKAAKHTTDGIAKIAEQLEGLGKGGAKPTDTIKRQFSEIKGVLGSVFADFSEDSKKVLMQGTADAEQLKKAFSGMKPVWKEINDVVTNSVGEQTKVLKGLEVTYTNFATKARESLKFNNNSMIDMDGDNKNLQRLWLPDTKDIKSVNSSMKETEISTKKAHEELNKLYSTGKLTSEQFKQLSQQSQKFTDSSSISLYNQKLNETLTSNKQLTKEKKEQIAVEEKIRKLQNSIVSAQGRDPKGLGANLQVSGMLDELKKIDPASKGASNSVKQVADSFQKMKASATAASRSSMTIMDSFRIAMEKFPVWMAASTAFYGTVRTIRNVMTEIVELDSQLTVLKRVSGMDTSEVNATLEESIRLAKELGNTIEDVNEGFISFARQGYRGEELTMLSEYATLLGNISDLSVEDSSGILTAGLKAFNMEAERGIEIVDSLNEIDNSYSVTTQQLATSMQRAAGTAGVYGMSMERLLGYTGAIAEITRESGSVIGKIVADVKSLLIDLELLTVLAEDNRAQARVICAA